MNDPTFNNGVTTDSVVDMVRDIGEVFKGNTNYITLPIPMDGIGPMTHIEFKDDSIIAPFDLDVSSHRSSQKGISRRSLSYNVSHLASISPVPSRPTKGLGKNVESIVVDIDKAMNLANTDDNDQDDEYVAEDEVDGPSNRGKYITSGASKPENVITGRPANRRTVYKGNAS